MNQDLFARMMSAVDEDLLEEAQRPVKTQKKRPWIALAASAAACVAVLASTMLHAPVPESPVGTMVVNPLQAVTVAEVEAFGYRIPLPEDAEAPAYYLINLGAEQAAPMAEVRFVRNGGEYTCRTLKTTASEDISGLYAQWSQNDTWKLESLEVTVMEAEDLTACVSWYEQEREMQWCLSGKQGASALLSTAGDILNTLGYDLDVAPAGAKELVFRKLTQDGLSVGETTFVLDGIFYAYRVAATNEVEENFADISGIEKAFAEEAAAEIGWCSARLSFDENAGGKIVWFDPAPGLLYSLYMETGASEAALLDMADLLYDPAQNDVG